MRLGLTALLMGLVACGSNGAPGSGARICTELGCIDQFKATLNDTSGGLPSGKQVVTVVANGTTLTCPFTLPRATTSSITCPKGLQVAVNPTLNCVTSGTGQYQTQTCTPVAGKFTETITVVGSPTTLHVIQTSDGVTYLDQTPVPTYALTRPNGPDCDPVCSEASADWTLGVQ